MPARAFNSRAIEAAACSGPDTTRQWLQTAIPEALREQAAIDLRLACGRNLWVHATQLEVTLLRDGVARRGLPEPARSERAARRRRSDRARLIAERTALIA
ncbi:hypothetical protein [Caballeronia sp. KNU42]